MTEVVFIGGSGRNGSTLLDRILGQVPGLWSGGELRFVWDRGFGADELCGCGQRFRACPFWSAVASSAFPSPSVEQDAIGRARRLRRAVERNRHVPQLLWPALRSRRLAADLAAYGDLLGRLYLAMTEVSGCRAIIDSSGGPLHAMALATVDSVDVSVVHLVRDSRAVTWSWQRKKLRPASDGRIDYMPRYRPSVAALEWDRANALLHLASRRGRRVQVRYEDLVDAPAATLPPLLEAIGHPTDGLDLDFVGEASVELLSGHTVSGNPIRFEVGRVALVRDEEWREAMPWRQRALATSLTLPLLVSYGYLGRRRAPRRAPIRMDVS